MKKIIVTLIFLAILLGGFLILNSSKTEDIQVPQNLQPVSSTDKIRFIPIGDSYTIGLGVEAEGRWPNVLVKNLQNAGINIQLITNPSVSGYTVQDAINLELPVIEREKPDLVTIFIGANDNFGNGDVNIYQRELSQLIDKTQEHMTNKDNLVLITIPDYSKSPAGVRYGARENISELIEQYNNVIKDEADKRGLKVVDLYPLSQAMTTSDLYINDGLHPSAKGYQLWEKEIYPVIYNLIKG